MNFDLFYKGDQVRIAFPYSANVCYKNEEGKVIDSDCNGVYVIFKNSSVICFKPEELVFINIINCVNKPSILDTIVNIISGKGFSL